MTRREWRWVLGVWLLAIIAGAWSGTQQFRSEERTSEAVDAVQQRMTDSFLGLSSSGWTAICTFLMFLATLALAYIAYNQFSTSRAQTRAYVGIDSGMIRYVNLIEGGRGLLIHIEIRNFGQTPGYKLTSWLAPPQILPADQVPFGPPTPIEDRGGSSMIGPHSNVNREWTIPVSEQELEALKTGQQKLFVWGGVDFLDAFGEPRHFIFKMVNGNANLVRAPGDVMPLQPHKLGYEAN